MSRMCFAFSKPVTAVYLQVIGRCDCVGIVWKAIQGDQYLVEAESFTDGREFPG